MLAAVLLVWGTCAVAGAGGARPAPVDVRRCCALGQRLAADVLAGAGAEPVPLARAAAACEPADARDEWAPRVYAPARRAYLERGRLPAHWRVVPAALPECQALRVLLEHAAHFALLAHDGSLQVAGPPPVALPPDRYCADASATLVCADALPATGAGVAKCCADAEAFDGARCAAAPERGARALEELRALAGGAGVRRGWPACAGGSRYAVAGALAGATLEADGALVPVGAGAGERLAAGAWCGEALLGAGGAAGWGAGGGALALACEAAARADEGAAGTGAGPSAARHTLYGAGLAVGALFLAATLAAGCALPAAHHALHWRCQTHYVAALMVGDALLAGTQLAGGAVPPALCRALAVCMHFLFLSAFFWLNTMCFNIWWTFRDFRPTSLERGQEAWRLRVYMLYAWGGPLVLAGAAALLDALPASAPDSLLRPRFGEQRCWFYGDLEILVYFFGPVGVLLLVNLALFVSTTRQLTCGLWRRDEVKSTSERAALGRVCAKLVVVMGVTWGADVVSWAAGGPDYMWYATDLLNALQGLLIFLVVGCQPHAAAALRRLACRALGCCNLGFRTAAGAGGAGRDQERADRHSSTHLPSCGESLTHTTAAPAPPPDPPASPPHKLPMETVC